DTPWPKVMQGKHALKALDGKPDHEELMQLLQDKTTPADDKLPDTGVGIEMERLLGSRFIQADEYGTRSSSSLLWESTDKVSLREHSYTPTGRAEEVVEFQFKLHS
ncbi:MAG: NRDE family protein, partial [Pseudomonadales bacterium]